MDGEQTAHRCRRAWSLENRCRLERLIARKTRFASRFGRLERPADFRMIPLLHPQPLTKFHSPPTPRQRYARLLRHSPLGFSHPKRTLPRKR